VAELERGVASPRLTLATEQLFAHQRPEARAQGAPCGFDQESRHRGALENPPNDRPSLGDRSFGRRQPIDPRRHQRFDRWRDRKRRVACLDDEADHLLDEKRVTLGDLEDPLPEGVRQRVR